MIPATGTRQFHLTTKFSEEEKAAVAAEEEEGDFDIIATLSNPFYGVPIGGLAAATAVATDFYIINEKPNTAHGACLLEPFTINSGLTLVPILIVLVTPC